MTISLYIRNEIKNELNERILILLKFKIEWYLLYQN